MLLFDRPARRLSTRTQQPQNMNAQQSKGEDSRLFSGSQAKEKNAPRSRNETASTPKRSDTPNLRQEDPPASHNLTREHIQTWKNSTNHIKTTYPYVDAWPCMYCLGYIDFRYRERCSRFRCENPECVGRGKLQVTCFWDAKAGIKKKGD